MRRALTWCCPVRDGGSSTARTRGHSGAPVHAVLRRRPEVAESDAQTAGRTQIGFHAQAGQHLTGLREVQREALRGGEPGRGDLCGAVVEVAGIEKPSQPVNSG